MSIADRKYGKDVTIFSVATKSLLAQFTECAVEHLADVAENSAVQDASATHRTIRKRWRVFGGLAVELHANNLMSLVGTEVAVAITSASNANGGTAYTGIGILTRFRHQMGDVQVCDFEIIGNGDLTAVAS